MKLLVFGHNDWWTWQRQGFCTRNAALVREFARRSEIEVIAVVDTPRFLTRSTRNPERRDELVSQVAPGVVAVRHDYILPLPARWRVGRRVNEAIARGRLRHRIGRALGPGGPVVLWVADPRMVEPALRYEHDVFVFDAIDDWRYHPWAGRRTVTAGYRRAASEAGVVLAVNADLLDDVRGDGLAAVVANAIDPDAWRDVRADYASVRGIRRPLVGYVGGLQRRFDARLLRAVSRRCPATNFVLVGRVSDDFASALHGLPPNVRLLGNIPYARVPGLVAAMDACIVPHVRDDLTRSMDPLKIYEYLAAGRPVVSTVPSPNPRLAPFVHLAEGHEEFARAVAAEIAEDSDDRRAARRAALVGETWATRVDQVLGLIAACLRSGSGAGARA